MSKKIRIILIIVLLIIVSLWISGVIPKQIAKIYGTQYLKNNFPKIHLEYENIEWSSAFGDYIIKFKDENNKQYSFVIGPKYFPINFGQGMHEFVENYREIYDKIENNMTATIKGVVVKVNNKSFLVMENDSNSLYSVGHKNDVEYKKGQEVLIYFDGMVMESYPAQLGNIGKIEIVKEISEIEIPEKILRYAYSSKDNVTVKINQLTKQGISINITDKNEYPYQFSNDYIILKKVKNENYTGVGQKIGEDTANSTAGFTRNRN